MGIVDNHPVFTDATKPIVQGGWGIFPEILTNVTETHSRYRSKLEFQDVSTIQRMQSKKHSKYRRRDQKTGVEKLFESRLDF